MYLFTLALTRVNVIQKYAGLMLHNKEKKLKNEKYERKQVLNTFDFQIKGHELSMNFI